MKIKGASFSGYKVKVNTYVFEKLDLFAFLFTQILLDENLDQNKKIVDCLADLDIKEDLWYLFNNIYYKMIDNLVIKDNYSEDLNEVLIKDIHIDPRFISYLKEGYFPILNGEKEKEFVYDYLKKQVVLADSSYKESNLCVLEVNNERENIEKIINEHKKSLFEINEGICLLKEVSVDPYYFDFSLLEKEEYYYLKDNNKEVIYKALKDNSLFITDKLLKGEYLSNNIYFKCLFSNYDLKEYCDYLFVYNKEKEFEVNGNVIYVDFKFEGDFIDLVNKERYFSGKYLLENNEYLSTFNKSKAKEVSDFKLYLMKNKEKFSLNITKIIELI